MVGQGRHGTGANRRAVVRRHNCTGAKRGIVRSRRGGLVADGDTTISAGERFGPDRDRVAGRDIVTGKIADGDIVDAVHVVAGVVTRNDVTRGAVGVAVTGEIAEHSVGCDVRAAEVSGVAADDRVVVEVIAVIAGRIVTDDGVADQRRDSNVVNYLAIITKRLAADHLVVADLGKGRAAFKVIRVEARRVGSNDEVVVDDGRREAAAIGVKRRVAVAEQPVVGHLQACKPSGQIVGVKGAIGVAEGGVVGNQCKR